MLCVLQTQTFHFENKRAMQYPYETTSFHFYESILPKKPKLFQFQVKAIQLIRLLQLQFVLFVQMMSYCNSEMHEENRIENK